MAYSFSAANFLYSGTGPDFDLVGKPNSPVRIQHPAPRKAADATAREPVGQELLYAGRAGLKAPAKRARVVEAGETVAEGKRITRSVGRGTLVHPKAKVTEG